ncbi:MAG TPA: hypothetical protein VFJ64_06420 [Solirubrobacterales bacterium]|nr:hypothetical protein [Solirubrobacterales bacterium]
MKKAPLFSQCVTAMAKVANDTLIVRTADHGDLARVEKTRLQPL